MPSTYGYYDNAGTDIQSNSFMQLMKWLLVVNKYEGELLFIHWKTRSIIGKYADAGLSSEDKSRLSPLGSPGLIYFQGL